MQLLWDEEKTRNLFKPFLIQVFISGIFFVVLSVLYSYNLVFAILAGIASITAAIFYYSSKNHTGIYFLIFMIELQTSASIFLALSTGFTSIIQFVPFLLILITLFELGLRSAVVLWIYTIINIILIYLWRVMNNPNASLNYEFILYLFSYTITFITEANIGKQLSLQFEAKKKLEQIDNLKNQFILATSHYLRTPITVIKGVLDKEAYKKHEKYIQVESSDLNSISHSASELNNLVEKFLLISTMSLGHENLHKELLNVTKVIEDVISAQHSFAMSSNVKLTYMKSKSPIPEFYFDKEKISSALENIINNGIKYNKINGEVFVRTKLEKNILIIEIEDTGTGIKKEYLETLFSTFNKGDTQNIMRFSFGIGLNLYTSKLVIENHGGSISVDSVVGKGSKFIIKLPINIKA